MGTNGEGPFQNIVAQGHFARGHHDVDTNLGKRVIPCSCCGYLVDCVSYSFIGMLWKHTSSLTSIGVDLNNELYLLSWMRVLSYSCFGTIRDSRRHCRAIMLAIIVELECFSVDRCLDTQD